MTRSRPSSESPPEFFVDRCLGRSAPRLLAERGWSIHLVADHFPDDGQAIADPEWIEYGLSRGWSLLTQDRRIRTQTAVHALLERYSGSVYCLSSSELPVVVRADRFDKHRAAIDRTVRAGKVGFFVVYEDEVTQRWP